MAAAESRRAPESAALRRGRDALGIAAAADERADPIAIPATVTDAVAERGDGARDLESGNIAGSRWRRILAAALQHVGTIDARGFNCDQDLAGARLDGSGRSTGLQDLRLARSRDLDAGIQRERRVKS